MPGVSYHRCADRQADGRARPQLGWRRTRSSCCGATTAITSATTRSGPSTPTTNRRRIYPCSSSAPESARARPRCQPAETVDIYPTLAALAGLRRPAGPQPIDGSDLTPALHDPAARVRGYAYHAYPRPGRIGQAIRTERYRLVRWTQEQTGARDYELYDHRRRPARDPQPRGRAARGPQGAARCDPRRSAHCPSR
jgi:hypothetical protein